MRKFLIHFLLATMLMIGSAATVYAQVTVKGQLVDAESGEPLVGASVTVEGTSLGSVTDFDGYFTQKVTGSATLVFKYIGYKDLKKKITPKGAKFDIGVIQMQQDAVILSDVTITSSVAVARKTPIAVSTIDPVFIEEKLGTQEFPEILKSTPGVHATKDGGGFGDSNIRLRGFKQENIAIMVNGVPMNGMENNKVYWSNWAGLSDVTRNMQVQRGIGASKVAAPSVGGSINVITKSTDAKAGGSVSYDMGDNGYNKLLFTVSSGLSKSGWAFSLLGAKTWGDGYVQGTEFEGYNYFLSIAKRFNENHQLTFSVFGAPQKHYQRSSYDGLTINGWQQVNNYMNGQSPYRYNPTYGFGKNGERKTSAYNEYHKPQLSLNHLWQIDNKSSLSTALYMSIGRGNGYSGQGDKEHSSMWYGSSNGTLNTTFRNADGTFAYDQIQEMNEQSTTGSKMVMSENLNNHIWYGLLSTYSTKFGENFDFYGGVDFRYYKGLHQNKIIDLYNGAYYVDRNRADVKSEFNIEASDPNFKNRKLGVGDVVFRDYDGYVMSEGVFGQLEYSFDKLNAFVAGSISNVGYWRYDRFYYDKAHAKSDTYNYLGWTLKGGLNYNISEHHNVFANVGYITRAPMFEAAFVNSQNSHIKNPDAKNEKIFSVEGGYGFRSTYFTANVNAYYTSWMNKAIYKSNDYSYTEVGTNNKISDRWTMNMTGVNAKHKGVELDFAFKPTQWIDLRGMFSIGDWRWDCNAEGYIYNSAGQPLKDLEGGVASGIGAEDHAKATVKMDNIHVGGAAQTTASLGVNLRPIKDLRVGLDWNFFGRDYADFTVDASSSFASKTEINEPWRIPSYSTFDLSAGYTFDFGKIRATLSGNVNNLFDQEYIADAYDGGGTWQKAYRVFYGFGRTYSIRLKFNF